MPMIELDIIQIGKVAGALSAIGVVGKAAHHWVWCPARRAYVNLRDTLAMVPGIVDQVAEIKREVLPNGGGSMRDVVNDTRRIAEASAEDIHHHTQVHWATLHDARCGIFETNADGEAIKINHMLNRLLGRASDELLGNNWVRSIAEHDRERVTEEWNNAIKFEREMEIVGEFEHSDGTTFKALVRARVTRKRNGDIDGWTFILTKLNAPVA